MSITLYRIDKQGFFVRPEVFHSDEEITLQDIRVPKGFVGEAPPKLEPGQRVLWRDRQWHIIDPPPEPTLEEVKAKKKAELAEARWMEETSGVTLPNGMEISTDDRSQMKMLSIYARAQADPSYSVRFKTPKGWVALDAETIVSLQSVVFGFVEALFRKEERKIIEVDACKTIEEVEAISWHEDISGTDSKE